MSDSTPHRVLVAGAGALGCVFGGFLARAGTAVTLLGRPPMIDAVRAGGLRITGIWGDARVTVPELATTADALAGPFDCVLITVKSYATAGIAREVAPLLAPDGIAVSLQNGLGNLEAVAEAVGEARTGGARVIFGAEVPGPGRVAVTVYAEPVLVGAPWAAAHPALESRLRGLVDALGATPIPTEWTDDLEAALWAKVLYNSALNPLGALLGVPYGDLAQSPHTRAVMDAAVAEAFRVARGCGVRLPWRDAAEYLKHFYARLVPPTAGHRASMLQDLAAGRPTEIGAINGQVVARGARLGIETPVNAALAAMIRFREGAGSAPWGAAQGSPRSMK
jgi:2-dehydropantoate 2-reductase